MCIYFTNILLTKYLERVKFGKWGLSAVGSFLCLFMIRLTFIKTYIYDENESRVYPLYKGSIVLLRYVHTYSYQIRSNYPLF